ncbi:LysR family transcriptional regulator [Endozoicomonas sp. SM1973]|uniref:LysR family transcriptional regulator n=1 Tax=Spartinivicinus marinus TaxID=2994442 RepID=A0A853IDM4_9GAMM|nr:LysR family transcriptional regulator [Spartinivicinus marinus]MCX4029315.1 LysR family transcriptional regulator [Spartinivicinus marinus]NYZ68154.1 LysR family transcriptional regulator [Spartinivicinus marinus]
MIRSLDSLRAFLCVAHHASFAKAASQLHLSSSSVSRHIAELEKDIGVTLLTRSTRKVAMTAAGRTLFEQASVLLTALDELGNRLKEKSQQVSGNVSLSAPWWFSTHFIAPILTELHQYHPELTISLDSNDQLLDPNEGKYDIYLRFGGLSDSGLIAKEITKTEYWLVAAPDYLEKHQPPNHPQNLLNHQLLAYRFTQPHSSWLFKDQNKHHRINLQQAWLHTNNPAAIYTCALSSGGIALLPQLGVAQAVLEGKLIRLFSRFAITPNRLDNRLYLIYSKDKVQIKRIKLVIDFLTSYLREQLTIMSNRQTR